MKPKARHLILDLLQAADGEALSARDAVTACALFGISANNARVALARLSADGLIEAAERGSYALSARAHELADDVATLRREREATDADWVAYVAGLGEADLTRTIRYSPLTDPTPITQPLAPALLHAFNHQTHHRGQAHAMLTRLTGDAPPLDLIYYERESGEGLGNWPA